MNFLNPLPSLVLCATPSAQMVEMKPKGGGELKIGDTLYRFDLTRLSTAPPKGNLSGAVKLEGNLVPQDAARAFHLTLTVLKDGSLYMLRIDRRPPGSYPDTWAATPKTRTRVLKLEDRPGGRIEIRCEGRLTGVLGQQPQDRPWSGTLWAVFPSAEGEGS